MKRDEKKLFQDIFTIKEFNPNNPFRNVSRVTMTSEYNLQMEIDINTQIYPVQQDNRFFIKVIMGEGGKNVYSPQEISKATEEDNYEYVMYGTVFSIDQKDNDLIIFVSFGGLIMKLTGKKNLLGGFRKQGLESRIFLLMRKA